jgi:hypothetical protein
MSLKVNNINNNGLLDLTGDVVVENLLPKSGHGYHLRQVKRYVETSGNSNVPTSFIKYTDFPYFENCYKNSKIKMDLYIPCRNEGVAWGGIAFKIRIRVRYTESGLVSNYLSIGNSGHSTLMNHGDQDINHFQKAFWIDVQEIFPETKYNNFDYQIEIYARGYDNAASIITSNNVNGSDSTPDEAYDSLSDHFYTELILYEYSSYIGL